MTTPQKRREGWKMFIFLLIPVALIVISIFQCAMIRPRELPLTHAAGAADLTETMHYLLDYILGFGGVSDKPALPSKTTLPVASINTTGPFGWLQYLLIVPLPFWAAAAGVFAKANVDVLELYIPQRTFPYRFRAIIMRLFVSVIIGLIFYAWMAQEAENLSRHLHDPSSSFFLLSTYFGGAYLFCCVGHDFIGQGAWLNPLSRLVDQNVLQR
jgi:hypothetical protein